MEHVKAFLDSSTIHGMSWISSSKRFSRLFWILVVIGGFTCAGYMIHQSLDNWNKSPITTTLETLPISDITFPNVSVCPPKNSILNFNYDIIKSTEIQLNTSTRKQLLDYAFDTTQDIFWEEIMLNISKLEYPSRYHDWYHGYTRLQYPYHNGDEFLYFEATYATTGNITTKYFGEEFDIEKTDAKMQIEIKISSPDSLENDSDSTAIFKVLKNTLKEIQDVDKMILNLDLIDADLTTYNANSTDMINYKYLYLRRKATKEDLSSIDQDQMPGFNLVWFYDREVEPQNYYSFYSTENREFVRFGLFQLKSVPIIYLD